MNERFAQAVDQVVQEYRTFEEMLDRRTPLALDEALRRFIGVIDGFDAEGHRAPALAADYRLARDALIYWIDEMLCVHCDGRWPYSRPFRDRCLERHYQKVDAHGPDDLSDVAERPPNGGFHFYEQAEVAKTRPDSDALETFLVCVALGFEGKLYRESKRREWVESTRRLLKDKHKTPASPAESACKPGQGPGPLYGQHFRLGVAVLVLVTALVTLAGFVVAVHLKPY